MTGNSSASSKAYDPAPYASLRSGAGTGTSPSESANAVPAKETAVSDFASEAERLKALREALWTAFEAGPEAGLPNTLIDLTMAYTGSLRLQLNLKALCMGKRKVAPASRPAPKPVGGS